jgi:hypothetical protein
MSYPIDFVVTLLSHYQKRLLEVKDDVEEVLVRQQIRYYKKLLFKS